MVRTTTSSGYDHKFPRVYPFIDFGSAFTRQLGDGGGILHLEVVRLGMRSDLNVEYFREKNLI